MIHEKKEKDLRKKEKENHDTTLLTKIIASFYILLFSFINFHLRIDEGKELFLDR